MVTAKEILGQLKDYVPGKSVEEVKEKWGLQSAIKLASNENPLGASPEAVKVLKEEAENVFKYPIGHAPELLKGLTEYLHVDQDQLILANGSDEIVLMIAQAYLGTEDEVIINENTFSQYKFCSQLQEAKLNFQPFTDDYEYDLDAYLEKINDKTKICFLCNPNNPTGSWIRQQAMMDFLKKVPSHVMVVVDQAYVEYATDSDFPSLIPEINEFDNLILMRTFSKIYGLAGLRIGYAIASQSIIKNLYKVKQPFNVNLLAQKAALAALKDDEFMMKSIETNELGKLDLQTFFNDNGIEYLNSQANFLSIKIGDAATFVEFLEKNGVIIRHLASFGMEEWVRVTIGTEADNQAFLKLFKEFLNERS